MKKIKYKNPLKVDFKKIISTQSRVLNKKILITSATMLLIPPISLHRD